MKFCLDKKIVRILKQKNKEKEKNWYKKNILLSLMWHFFFHVSANVAISTTQI